MNTLSIWLIQLIIIITLSFSLNAQSKINIDSVFKYICEKGIQHPEIVIKQAVLETGWFKSPFLMTRNNIFGFRKNKYMRFNNWKECVDYYKTWQEKRYKNNSEDYYKFLVRIKYATNLYPIQLKKIKLDMVCH
jgi:hypothetical protein